MAKVYIVQENPNVNVIGAGRFGELIPLLPPGRQITLSSSPVIKLLKTKLKNFSDDMSSPTNQDLKGPLVIFETDGQEFKFSKGGRVGLKGGGICKKGMNKKAFGKNS